MTADPLRIPLTGTTLVEASAGTGKTWTIGALWLRLLLEGGRSVGEILVLTFTEAATAELRDRLRDRLSGAAAALEAASDAPFADALLEDLRARLSARGRWEPAPLGRLLKTALAQFDEASIFTIHGFCMRVLRELPLETAAPPGAEIAPGDESDLRGTVEDELRRHWAAASPGWLAWLGGLRGPGRGAGGPTVLEPEAWTGLLRERLQHPLAELAGDAPEQAPDAARVEAARTAAVDAALLALRDAGATALIGLLLASGLHGGTYKADNLPGQFTEVERWLAGGAALAERPLFFKWLRQGEMRVNKNGREPEHAFFAACAALSVADAALEAAWSALLARLVREALETWPAKAEARRRAGRRLSYDDLLLSVRGALAGPGGESLAARLGERWTAALIDEFQDTDPVQADIFRRAFERPDRPLVFVGDPKQAIYAFRGADIHAYLSAAGRADHRATLALNWRSSPNLIDAVNRIFAAERFPAARGAFLQPRIVATPVHPAPRPASRLRLPAEEPALQVVRLPEELPAVDGARRLVAADLALRVARRLAQGAAGEAWIEREGTPGRREPVEGRHLAVLVRRHSEGRLVADALARRGVPCVQLGDASLWSSEEADALARLFEAFAQPARAGAVLAALASPLFGLEDAELARLSLEDGALESWQELCAEAAAAWSGGGFSRALRAFARRTELLSGLLLRSGGERRATNLLHLLERLQEEAALHRRGPAELAARLRELARDPKSLEAPLRLESEENLVRVVTQHRCKGLEYEIVYAPFLWASSADRTAAVDLRRLPGDGGVRLRAVLPGAALSDAEREDAAVERLSEDLRLCYVALTRAKLQCVIHDGKAGRDQGPGALDWLLLGGGDDPAALSGWKTAAPGALAMRRAAWDALAAGPSIGLASLGDADAGDGPSPPAEQPELHARAAPAALPARSAWRLSSFSSLVAGLDPEEPDHDRLGAAGDGAPDPDGEDRAGRFPRGARAGSCLHAILERPFRRPPRQVDRALCGEELRRFGFDAALAEDCAAWLGRVLAAPVDGTGWSLERIDPQRALPELEFHLSARAVSGERLRAALAEHGWPASGLPGAGPESAEDLALAARRLAPTVPAGLLKGFIDLVYERDGRWWILDWKSNHLGPNAAAYTGRSMIAEMGRAGYLLQALLYGLALHRHLALRLPGYDPARHLGGWQYVFLRGVDGAPGAGIVSGAWPPALLARLDGLLGAPDGGGGHA